MGEKVCAFVICLLLFQFVFAQNKFDFYVSDQGNNNNPGTFRTFPKKTISATAPLLDNFAKSHILVSLGLKSGEVFNDTLVTSYPIYAGAYSDSGNVTDFAVLNGSQEYISGWKKVSGSQNSYEQPITYHGFSGYGINGIGSYSYIYVTEIDRLLEKTAPYSARKPMIFVHNFAQLDSIPGSCYSPINTTENPKLMYIHTSDGIDPNGHPRFRYEVTIRDWAINSTYQSNNVFENLWVRGYGAGNGMLPSGDNSNYNKVIFGPGAGIHHVVLRSGTINHSLFLPGSRNTSDFAVVFYDVNGDNKHCTIKNSIFLDIPAPVYAHTSDSGTNFGAVEMDHVTGFAGSNGLSGFMFTSNNDSVILNQVYADGYSCGYNYGSAKFASIRNCYFKDVIYGIGYSNKNPVTAIVDNVFIKTKSTIFNSGIYMQPNTSLTVTNSIIHVNNNYVNFLRNAAGFIFGAGNATSQLKATGNIFICDINPAATLNAATVNNDNGIATTHDKWNNNVYILLRGNNIAWMVSNAASNKGNTVVANFEEWKRQSGQDQNSLFFDLRNDPRGLKAIFADPDNGNYDLANTAEGRQVATLHAGMTTPLTCFLQKPTYEEAAEMVRSNTVLSVNQCRNPCQQNSLIINHSLMVQQSGEQQVKVEWNVEEQQNIRQFEIQRATGNDNFIKIATLPVTADTVYSFNDFVQAGIPYQYRIAVIPKGVGRCYSEARTIKITDSKLFTIFPNPSDGKFMLSMNGYVGKATVKVINCSGQNAFSKEIFSIYNLQEIDLSHYPKGMYFIKVETSNSSGIQKIILQ
jgi:Secretion system C-terminal sorting domain